MTHRPPEDAARVHVFLSSSMATAEHMALREELRTFLEENSLLEVFAIEAVASGDTSDEIMLSRIEDWADVVLMLLQDDLRSGVEKELRLAKRFGKRLLILVQNGEKTAELEALIRKLRKPDMPFQGTYEGIEDLKTLAKRSLLRDVAVEYRNSQRELHILRKQVGFLIPDSVHDCHDFLSRVYLPREADHPPAAEPEGCVATRSLLEVVLRGGQNVPADSVEQVVGLLPQEYRQTVKLRWSALESALSGDFPNASDLLKEARTEAEAQRLRLWIRRDITLDLDYMEICRANRGDKAARERIALFQGELQSLSGWESRSPIYYDLFCLGHRFLEETVKWRLTSERTLVFGTNLPTHLEDLSEALIAAVWTGSYSILRLVRRMLARVLLHYGFQYDDRRLLYEGACMLAIEGEHGELEAFLKLHADSIATEASRRVLAPGAFPALEAERPEMRMSKSLFYKYLGDYVPDADLGRVKEFLRQCYDYDVALGFYGSVMRGALAALPTFAPRLDARWGKELAYPLLTGHSVVAGEAVEALAACRLADLSEDDLTQITDSVLDHLDESLPGPRFELALALSNASAQCRRRFADAFRRAWVSRQDPRSIRFLEAAKEEADAQLLAEMATGVLAQLELADGNLTETSPMSFGGDSGWLLLGALLDLGAEVDERHLVAVIEQVLSNKNQGSWKKRDCLRTVASLAAASLIDRAQVLQPVGAFIASHQDQVLAARGFRIPFSAAREELEIYSASVTAAARVTGPDSALEIVARYANHARLDTRLAAVDALRFAIGAQEKAELRSSILLLQVLGQDPHFQVRRFAVHGLSEAVRREESCVMALRKTLERLSRDEHPVVRAAVVHAASPWHTEMWAERLITAALEDAHYRVRETARQKEGV